MLRPRLQSIVLIAFGSVVLYSFRPHQHLNFVRSTLSILIQSDDTQWMNAA